MTHLPDRCQPEHHEVCVRSAGTADFADAASWPKRKLQLRRGGKFAVEDRLQRQDHDVYDSNNRLQSKTPDPSFNAPAVGFTYSATGKRLTMSDVSGVTTYTYDPQTDRLMQKQTPEGTLNYTYDAAGNLKSLQSQNQGGASDAYSYDADNRLSTVTDASGQTTYAYDNVGNLQSFAYPNGVTTAYTYDQLNRLTQMGAGKNGTQQANYVYTLGAAGNRLSVAELSGRTVSYGYDSLYRLTSESVSADPHGNNGTGAYTYDNVGNRLILHSSLPPAGMMNYSYDADDRLGSDQYDPNGNTINSLAVVNTYDFENHLVQHGAQPGAVTIVYDGDGNRVSETVAGVTTQYLVDTQNPTGYAQVVDELVSGRVTKTYSYGLERISQNWQPTTGNWQPAFYDYDGHGSVRQLTNSAGAVTDTYDFDAFGNLISSTGSTPNAYLFAGEQYDPALGLYYNRARYYNSPTGRFWTMDTYEGTEFDPQSLHKYLFANGDPINEADPTGHEPDIGTTEGAIAIDEELEGTLASIENATELLAKQEAAAKIVIGTLAAAALLLAADFIYENKTKKEDGKLRRGRIGIQGNDLRKQAKRFANSVSTITNQLEIGTGGGTVSFSRDTLAWGWSRTWPVLKVEGTSAIDAMVGQLGQNQVACRKSAIQKAKATINSGPLPQGFSKDFPGENYSFCDGSERVDIQVYLGTAFER